MIGPSNSFAELAAKAKLSGVRFVELPDDVVPSQAAMDDVAREAGVAMGLQFQRDNAVGSYMVIEMPNGDVRNVSRRPVYSIVPPWDVMRGVQAIVHHIAQSGTGRVWTLQGIVHVIRDDAKVVGEMIGDVPHVRLRCFFVHENAQ